MAVHCFCEISSSVVDGVNEGVFRVHLCHDIFRNGWTYITPQCEGDNSYDRFLTLP